MVELVCIFLVLEDGRLVMQRRDDKARYNPMKLGMFGGRAHKDESPEQAMKRELGEETSLNVEDLQIDKIASMQIPKSGDNPIAKMTVFRTRVKSADFEVYEGIGTETHELKELMARNDIDYYIKFILQRIKSDGFINN